MKQWKGCRTSCDLGKAAEGLENKLPHSPTLRRFTYVTAQSTTLPPLHLCHSLFSNPSAALPTSQLILQPFRCFIYVIGTCWRTRRSLILQPLHRFTYVTAHSPTLPPHYLRPARSTTLPPLYLRHSSFYNPSVASPTS